MAKKNETKSKSLAGAVAKGVAKTIANTPATRAVSPGKKSVKATSLPKTRVP